MLISDTILNFDHQFVLIKSPLSCLKVIFHWIPEIWDQFLIVSSISQWLETIRFQLAMNSWSESFEAWVYD